MKIGLVGLGRMGGNMARRLMRADHQVVGYARNPDTVRAPDVAFIHRDHLPEHDPPEAYWPGAPDLAVEVLSPGDTQREVDDKVEAWLAAGAAQVWEVNPGDETVTVHRGPNDAEVLGENDTLDGGEAVPGFRCHVSEFFAG